MRVSDSPPARPASAMHTAAALLLAAIACRGASEASTPARAPAPTESPPVDVRAEAPREADPAIAEILAAAAGDNRVDEHLRHLVQEIGPRLSSSHALTEAETWAAAEFESWGLEVAVETWGSFPVGFDRGAASGGMVRPERIDYDFTTMAWSAGTSGPVRGQAILYPRSEAELAAMRPRLRGAWLVQPREAIADSRLAAKVERAIDKAGVAGVVFAAGGPDDLLVHTAGGQSITWDALPTRVRVFLRGDQHHDLVTRLESGAVVQLQFAIDNHFYEGPVELHNVVADLRGAERPDEFVIVGGHLDSWDGAAGAVDNGTGVATTMEAARLLAGLGRAPRRTLRFVLWTGEEQGMLGSKAYVEAHRAILPDVSAVFVHDEGTNYLAGLEVTPEMLPALQRVFAPVQALAVDRPFELIEREGLRIDASDHAPFVRAGVPAFLWVQRGRADYERVHHTQYDRLEEVIPEYQRHSALVVALAAWNTAALDGLLERRNSSYLEPRSLGVVLRGNELVRILEEGRAARLGWQLGDRLLEVDGTAITGGEGLALALDRGGARKRLVLERRGVRTSVEVDFSDDADEAERQRRRAERAATRPRGTTAE